MSGLPTIFSYGGVSVQMDTNPLMERNHTEERTFVSGFDSSGKPYAYDDDTPIFYEEQLVFPAESLTKLNSLIAFCEQTLMASQTPFQWSDQGTIRTAIYKGLQYTPITKDLYQVTFSVEVQS